MFDYSRIAGHRNTLFNMAKASDSAIILNQTMLVNCTLAYVSEPSRGEEELLGASKLIFRKNFFD